MPTIIEFVSNPMLILIVGALVTGLLVPYITNQWQNHQKELELKTDLVAEISDVVTRMILAIQFAEVGATSFTQEDYDKSYSNFLVSSAIIGSKIRSYFPDTQLGKEWDTNSKIIEDLYALSGITNETRRLELLQKINTYLSTDSAPIELGLLVFKGNTPEEQLQWQTNWGKLRDKTLERKDNIIQAILKNRIPL